MRWALIGTSGYDSLEYHLEDSLLHLGQDVRAFDLALAFGMGMKAHYWLRRFSESYDRRKAEQLAHAILEYKPDIVLGVYRFIHPRTIEVIKAKSPSTIAIHFNPDQLITLEQQQIIASPYDYYFTKDPFMQRFMKNMAGLNAFYLPESFNQRIHVPPVESRALIEEEVNTDILMFGSMYPYRARIIEQIRKAGFSIKLFGTRARFFPPSLSPLFTDQVIRGKEKSKLLVGAKIVINSFHYAEVESVNCKYFEINGVGGFQLCDNKPVLSTYSPVNPEAYAYNNIDQAIELIEYYMPRSKERHEIGSQQRDHFLRYHTYDHRVRQIMEIIS